MPNIANPALIDVRTGKALAKYSWGEHPDNQAGAVTVVSRDDRWLAMWRRGYAKPDDPDNKKIKLFDAATGQVVGILDAGLNINGVVFSPDSSLLAATEGNVNGAFEVWDVRTQHLIRRIPAKELAAFALAFGNGGKAIIYDEQPANFDLLACEKTRSCESSRQLVMRDLATGGPIWSARHALDEEPTRLALSPTGEFVTTINFATAPILWNGKTGARLHTLEGIIGSPDATTYSADGRRIIVANSNATIVVWDADNGARLTMTAFSPDDQWVTITPEGFFAASERGAQLLHVVRGFQTTGIDQLYQSLYRPDLVREKLAGDPDGLVKNAQAHLDLDIILASGNPPSVSVVSPADGARADSQQTNVAAELADRGGGIGRVEWRVNGITVAVDDNNGPSPPNGQAKRLSRDLALDGGDNAIEVVAYNKSGLIASPPARIAVAAPATTASQDTRVFVLAVGLDGYADPYLRLQFAVGEAQALADEAFAKLAASIQPNDIFVFFLAGHGKTADGQYYFIPQDLRFTGMPSVVAGGISQQQWQNWFAKIAAKRSVLLFDTCESASLVGRSGTARALEQSAASARLAQATGRTIVTAATGDAIEGFHGHGLFTYYLMQALHHGDSDGDGKIEVAELAAYVYAEVTAMSDQVFGEYQEPQIRITGPDYPLTNALAEPDAAAPAVPAASSATDLLAIGTKIYVEPSINSRAVHMLRTQAGVNVLRSKGGWALVGRNGEPIGYVATSALKPLQ